MKIYTLYTKASFRKVLLFYAYFFHISGLEIYTVTNETKIKLRCHLKCFNKKYVRLSIYDLCILVCAVEKAIYNIGEYLEINRCLEIRTENRILVLLRTLENLIFFL